MRSGFMSHRSLLMPEGAKSNLEAFHLEFARVPAAGLRQLARAMEGVANSIERSEQFAAETVASRDREFRLRSEAEKQITKLDGELHSLYEHFAEERRKVRRLQVQIRTGKKPAPRSRRKK